MAEFEKRLACVIAADGSIARGYMIDKCELVGTNEYVITWKVPLQNRGKNQLLVRYRQRRTRAGGTGLLHGRTDGRPDEDARPHL